MVSRRLVAAVAVQVAAAAALMTPASADPFWPMEECSEETVGMNPTECTDSDIWWGPDDWTVIADGFVCEDTGGGNYDWVHTIFWSEDTDDEGYDDALQQVQDECANWEQGGGGAT